MRMCLLSALLVGLVCGVAGAQGIAPAVGVTGASNPSSEQTQRSGQSDWGGAMNRENGLIGTITEATYDHYTIQTDTNESYIVYFSTNTRILKYSAAQAHAGSKLRSNMIPPVLKPSDLKVGDAVIAVGKIKESDHTVEAILLFQVDPKRAKAMREQQTSYGKTWLAGAITAMDDTKITLEDPMNHSKTNFLIDKNTLFFDKNKAPIALSEIHVGDRIRAEGSIQNGNFLAATVNANPEKTVR